MPSRIVCGIDRSSLPGTIARARKPKTRPTMTSVRSGFVRYGLDGGIMIPATAEFDGRQTGCGQIHDWFPDAAVGQNDSSPLREGVDASRGLGGICNHGVLLWRSTLLDFQYSKQPLSCAVCLS